MSHALKSFILLSTIIVLSTLSTNIGLTQDIKPAKTTKVYAVNGVLDLTGYDIDKIDQIYLDGEWKFYKDGIVDKEHETIRVINATELKSDRFFGLKNNFKVSRGIFILEILSKNKLDNFILDIMAAEKNTIYINNIKNNSHINLDKVIGRWKPYYTTPLFYPELNINNKIVKTKIKIDFNANIPRYAVGWAAPKIINKNFYVSTAKSINREFSAQLNSFLVFSGLLLLFIYLFSKINIGFFYSFFTFTLMGYFKTLAFTVVYFYEEFLSNIIYINSISLFFHPVNFENIISIMYIISILCLIWKYTSKSTKRLGLLSILYHILLSAQTSISDLNSNEIIIWIKKIPVIPFIFLISLIKDLIYKRYELKKAKNLILYFFIFASIGILTSLIDGTGMSKKYINIFMLLQNTVGLFYIGMPIVFAAFYDGQTEVSKQEVHQKMDQTNAEMNKLNLVLKEKVDARKNELDKRQAKVTSIFNKMENAILLIDLNLSIYDKYSIYTKNIFPNIETTKNFLDLFDDSIKKTILNQERTFINQTIIQGGKHIQLDFDPIYNDKNEITYYILVATDITLKVQAQAKQKLKLQEMLEKVKSKKSHSAAYSPRFKDFLQNINTENYAQTRSNLNYLGLDEILQDEIASLKVMATTMEKPSPLVNIISNNTKIHKNLCQTIKDVMVHCLRNSLDHGIENETERKAKGKNPTGTITLELNNNELIVYDDGRGLNLNALRKKINDPNVQDSVVAESIFLSGMSTAAKVTDISGRGVGMDAVKSFIMEKGGNIEIVFRDEITQEVTSLDFRPFGLKIKLPQNMTRSQV